ncbi:DUF6624 domain-containing protein [Leptolyngbya sp. FACHB-711]|uniref:DUF6624 domain-containing protein n=1 Tax=Leptolyngbya sp. FACHB-711 TaxID=2692813 RepID=UPI001689FE55|nr:DUF6624 domain-containing protein [Leptolyngbya sp. FACHB-711]MBD2023826.1 hypothetical protein [Leptolyngbya sp. FACHB-711]
MTTSDSNLNSPPPNMSIADELVQMGERDQEMRNSQEWDAEVDIRNTQRLKQIIGEIGWPSISKVGREAANYAWLLAQHADHDVAFQRDCLHLMQHLMSDVDATTVAYLEDRVRVNEGRPQLYGTQYYEDEQGVFGPRPIEQPDEVDERRRAVGLEPLAEYDRAMRQLQEEMGD